MNDQLMYILNQISKIDYLLLIEAFSPTIGFFVGNSIGTHMRLHKDFKPKDISKVSIPSELKQKYSSVDINQIASDQFKEITLEFASLMIEKFPLTALINFYNNINELKIERKRRILILGEAGAYSGKFNKIKIAITSAIFHELFHMASAIYKEESDIYYCGFSQRSLKDNSVDIGDGLNEGYTELLAHRYFEKKHKMSKAYKFEVVIAEKLEKIIEQDKMEILYLNADLPGLIAELKKYISEEEISKFISALDFISCHSNDILIFKNDKIKKSIINIYEFLFKTYMSKLKQQLENRKISVNDFIEQSTQYIESLRTSVRVGGHNYEFLTMDKLLENWKSISDVSKLPNDIQDITSNFKR